MDSASPFVLTCSLLASDTCSTLAASDTCSCAAACACAQWACDRVWSTKHDHERGALTQGTRQQERGNRRRAVQARTQARSHACRLNLLSQVVGRVIDHLAIHHAPPVLTACTHPSLCREKGRQSGRGHRAACSSWATCSMQHAPARSSRMRTCQTPRLTVQRSVQRSAHALSSDAISMQPCASGACVRF